jgi:hypothetical protein
MDKKKESIKKFSNFHKIASFCLKNSVVVVVDVVVVVVVVVVTIDQSYLVDYLHRCLSSIHLKELKSL